MKKNLLTAILIIATSTTFATVRTVSNQIPNPGQYTTIQAAINVSSNGDTVYVHGSNDNYAGFALDRQLTIIGAGFEPSSANPFPYSSITIAPSITINNVNASGSKITGLYLSNIQINFTVPGIHDFTISRCRFYSTSGEAIVFALNMYNITVAENQFYQTELKYLYTGGPDNGHDFLITNNVFRVYDSAFYNWIGVTNVQVVNNLFYGGGAARMVNASATGVSGLAFSNNIFNKVLFSGISSCTFSNNITNQCTGNTPWINNGTDLGVPAFGTQNIANTSPNFVNQVAIDAAGYANVNWFVVNPGSPTLSSMPGDPDMGPYGGSGSYNFNRASASTLPYVYSLSIGNPTIQSGTNLNIDVIGKKHD